MGVPDTRAFFLMSSSARHYISLGAPSSFGVHSDSMLAIASGKSRSRRHPVKSPANMALSEMSSIAK